MTKPILSRTLFGFRLRTLLLLAALLLAGLAALGLDLRYKGRIYDLLWNLTGETDPAQQLLGFGQYLARYTRDQPDTAPYAAIEHADVNPFGVNTFLEQEVEPQKRERQVQMIADAGFHWLRQQFPWEDIEIHGKGDFMDRRHDRNGDGVIDEQDAISAWDKYDHIVGLAEQYGLELIVRLSAPPRWSHPNAVRPEAPPDDFQDFVDYAAAVATRYRGRVTYYQVWNEPNLYPEWGDQTVNAEAYTDLLCRTYRRLKEIDPSIVVLTGALGPTVDLSGRNAYDLLYLQRMYQAGAGDCFDILSVQGYGLWSGPTDRRLRQVTINYQRHLWVRDIMVANGDAHKAIWISEAGWNPVPDDPAIHDPTRYGRVTMEQAAEWAPLAYARAIKDWPWIGVINYWYFKRADWTPRDEGQPWFYFRLVDPDFTPTPIYESLKAYITGAQPKVIGAGRHGADHRGVKAVNSESRETIYTFRFDGTGVYLCPAQGGAITAAAIDGEPVLWEAPPSGCALLRGDLAPGEHTLRVVASQDGALDSLVIVNFAARQRLPWLLTAGIAAAFAVIVLGRAVIVRWGG